MPDGSERKQQALELVRKLRYGHVPDEEVGDIVEELERIIPNPNWTDLLFYHEPELSDEEAVEKALTYRPFAL